MSGVISPRFEINNMRISDLREAEIACTEYLHSETINGMTTTVQKIKDMLIFVEGNFDSNGASGNYHGLHQRTFIKCTTRDLERGEPILGVPPPFSRNQLINLFSILTEQAMKRGVLDSMEFADLKRIAEEKAGMEFLVVSLANQPTPTWTNCVLL